MEKIRGTINVGLDEKGFQQAAEVGEAFAAAGEPFYLISSDLVRTVQTTQEIMRKARKLVKDVDARKELEPWHLGRFEGMSSEAAAPKLKLYTVMVDKPVPGPSKSGAAGESFNAFKKRFLDYYHEVILEAEEKKKIVLVTHHRNIKLLNAWLKAGAAPDYSIDLDEFNRYQGEDGDRPGDIFRVGAAGLKKAERPRGPGIYVVRHGETELNV